MALNLYLPPAAISPSPSKVPVLFYLSGLSCTGDNCADKGFFQAHASKQGIAVVYPDTSPRGANIEGEDESWDFGSGAGFYVDATEEKWRLNYNMYTYITEELPEALFASFDRLDSERVSITGHSMGGHGALTLVGISENLLWVDLRLIGKIVPQESWEIPFRFRLGSHHQPDKLPLGSEGLHWLFRRSRKI